MPATAPSPSLPRAWSRLSCHAELSAGWWESAVVGSAESSSDSEWIGFSSYPQCIGTTPRLGLSKSKTQSAGMSVGLYFPLFSSIWSQEDLKGGHSRRVSRVTGRRSNVRSTAPMQPASNACAVISGASSPPGAKSAGISKGTDHISTA